MYKVFFNDRSVLLSNSFSGSFNTLNGLFYKYDSTAELGLIIEFFEKTKNIPEMTLFHSNVEKLYKHFKSCFRYIEAAGGIVQNTEGKYLFIERLGKWDIPKGKAEKNESPEETAIREIEEECGISNVTLRSTLPPTYHTYYDKKNRFVLKKTHWYMADYKGDEKLVPQTKEDITKAKWISAKKISKIKENTYLSILDVIESAGL